MKEKGTCGSHFKIKIKNKYLVSYMDKETREKEGRTFLFLFLFFFFSRFSLRYTEIGPSEFVRARTNRLYSTRATHENQKQEISLSFQLKFEKSYVLLFLRSTTF